VKGRRWPTGNPPGATTVTPRGRRALSPSRSPPRSMAGVRSKKEKKKIALGDAVPLGLLGVAEFALSARGFRSRDLEAPPLDPAPDRIPPAKRPACVVLLLTAWTPREPRATGSAAPGVAVPSREVSAQRESSPPARVLPPSAVAAPGFDAGHVSFREGRLEPEHVATSSPAKHSRADSAGPTATGRTAERFPPPTSIEGGWEPPPTHVEGPQPPAGEREPSRTRRHSAPGEHLSASLAPDGFRRRAPARRRNRDGSTASTRFANPGIGTFARLLPARAPTSR